MNYKELFLNYVNSLTENKIEDISKSKQDIYWNQKEFYLWPHGVRNQWGDLKVFDSIADEDFDAKAALNDFADVVEDVLNSQSVAIGE